MRLAIDLDSGEVRTWAGQAAGLQRLKRGDRLPVELRYTRNGAVVERPTGATGRLGIKVVGALAGEFIVFSGSWTKTGTGGQAIYTFDLNTNTVELHALFEDEPGEVALVMEIESTAPNELRSSATVPIIIENDVIRGDEGLPTSGGSRFGKTAIPNGESVVEVEFDEPYSTANWHFVGSPVVSNTTDDPPLGIFPVSLIERSATGFKFLLSAETDSANYNLEWFISLD
jgi:hypothetical protein